MAVTLTKEDGTIVAGATTYADLDDLTAFLAQRGQDALGIDPQAAGVALIGAMDLLSTYADKFVGRRVSAAQALDWPRNGIALLPWDSVALPDQYMPPELLAAQCAAAMAALQGAELMPTVGTDGFVTREKIGPVETDYAIVPGVSTTRPRIPLFEAYLRQLIRGGGPVLLVTRA